MLFGLLLRPGGVGAHPTFKLGIAKKQKTRNLDRVGRLWGLACSPAMRVEALSLLLLHMLILAATLFLEP